MTQQDEEKFLTPAEACKLLGVSRRTLERYVDQGDITKYRRGITRAVFFKQVELERLLTIRPENKQE